MNPFHVLVLFLSEAFQHHTPIFAQEVSSTFLIEILCSYVSRISHPCYLRCLSHLPWFHHSGNVRRSVRIMKLHIMQFCRAPCSFPSLSYKYFLLHCVLEYPGDKTVTDLYLVKLCSLVKVDGCFKGVCCLTHQRFWRR